MKIEIYYEETSNLGNYESIKIGLRTSFEKDIKGAKELVAFKDKCFKLVKSLVKNEISKEKGERENEE